MKGLAGSPTAASFRVGVPATVAASVGSEASATRAATASADRRVGPDSPPPEPPWPPPPENPRENPLEDPLEDPPASMLESHPSTLRVTLAANATPRGILAVTASILVTTAMPLAQRAPMQARWAQRI
jgi:hypothetical protein